MSQNPALHIPPGNTLSGKRAPAGAYVAGNASLLLEKTRNGLRRSTPDSEALASSDDEQDHHRQITQTASRQLPKPTRRPSWVSDGPNTLQRNSSATVGAPFTNSGVSNIMAADTSTWSSSGSPLTRVYSGSSSYPWDNQIWTNEAQKGQTLRFAEALAQSSNPGEEPLRSPSIRRDSVSEAAIPFAIPLQPTLKTYRSQSYSVGQLEQEIIPNGSSRATLYNHTARSRPGSSYGSLQHRLSRPSMLGDYPHDNAILEQLREVDDDDEDSNTSSDAGMRFGNSHSQARRIEQLAMENALLRQKALEHQIANLNLSNQLIDQPLVQHTIDHLGGQYAQLNDAVIEDPEDIHASGDDQGPMRLPMRYGRITRRLSEYGGYSGNYYTSAGTAENRVLENVKRGHWQSSLGFGGIIEPAQSRRHSLADIPKRQTSMSSLGEFRHSGEGRAAPSNIERIANPSHGDNTWPQPSIDYRPHDAEINQMVLPSSIAQHSLAPHFPHGRLGSVGHAAAYRAQSLYLVTFKAARAEFYYVQEGIGLDIKAGDLVIVEADRGTDLGTVAHENVSWADAKALRDQYVEEHYKWLMMFSRRRQEMSSVQVNGSTGPPGGRTHGSAIGGMGPHGTSTMTDPMNTEIKPKMIKRLAQTHEIQTLKDKEANEAKAKRMCQVKADEHHLDMEILDAEFQMDWKKLTFYYFADAYINFNSLVTDLFKIYKTRIWMSAINPASFATPTAGVQMPSGLGPGAILADRERFEARQSLPPQGPLAAAWNTQGSNGLGELGPYRQMYHQDVDENGSRQLSYDQRMQAAMGTQALYGLAPYSAMENPPIPSQVTSLGNPYAASMGGWSKPYGLPLGS